MGRELFAVFSRTIDGIPAKAVPRAVELERWLIQDDLAHQRNVSIHDAASILCFCHFLMAAKSGEEIHPSVLPMEHVPFYRQTVERLVEAGELPSTAIAQFDITFSDGFLSAMAA
jgi:hypothetical protein